MSGPRARSRETPAPAQDQVARGASRESLEEPAGVFLAGVAWEGPALDPDALDAAAFLAWL